MSRLTGTDAYSLMEAYQAVYAPQEITEEQVWEEVETWVNSLLEEGYDLSDYTWEEMYESYLEEAGMDTFKAIRDANSKPSSVFTKPIQKAPPLGQPGSGFQDRRPVLGMPSNNSLTLPPNRVGPGLVGGKVGPKIVGPKIVGPGRVGSGAAPATSASPAAPAPRPAAAAPAAPKVAPKPAAATPAPAGGSALDRATAAASGPTAFSPKPQSDVGAMIARSQARQAAQTPKPATPAPAARPMGGARGRLMSSFDPFDVIKGHLLDEGYADTEEAALKIMANMSEEWRQSIVEAQEARNNPEKYENDQSKKKSKKQKAMEDPHTGINSPAFAAFMKQQGR